MAFRKMETCSERSSSDNVVAERHKLLKCLWWHGPTQGQSHWKELIYLLIFHSQGNAVLRNFSMNETAFSVFIFFLCFWFLKGGRIICSCFSALVTGEIWLETWAFNPGICYWIRSFECIFVIKRLCWVLCLNECRYIYRGKNRVWGSAELIQDVISYIDTVDWCIFSASGARSWSWSRQVGTGDEEEPSCRSCCWGMGRVCMGGWDHCCSCSGWALWPHSCESSSS